MRSSLFCNTSLDYNAPSVDHVTSFGTDKKLKDFPALKVEFWKKLSAAKFEEQPAKTDLTMQDAFKLLDYVSYFDLLKIEQPDNQVQMVFARKS